MHSRDIAIVAAVVLLAGFAIADALRSDDSAPPEASAPRPTTATAETDPEGDGGSFPGVAAPGSLILLSGDTCRVRQASVASGSEFPLPEIRTGCALSAPLLGNRLAYAVGEPDGRGSGFRFVSLNEPLRDLGRFDAPLDSLVWSADGQHAGWCDQSGQGFVYELGSELREVERCPRGYTPLGEPAYAVDGRIVVGGRTFGVVSDAVRAVRWGSDGSVALVLRGGAIERSDPRGHATRTVVPEFLRGRPLVLAPDNCAALVVHTELVALLDLGCFAGEDTEPRPFVGHAATWSPDGDWIAVAEGQTVAFHRVVGEYRFVRWNVEARDLAWLE
jgi:hypothetical protein